VIGADEVDVVLERLAQESGLAVKPAVEHLEEETFCSKLDSLQHNLAQRNRPERAHRVAHDFEQHDVGYHDQNIIASHPLSLRLSQFFILKLANR
jgi:hypothetical protein